MKDQAQLEPHSEFERTKAVFVGWVALQAIRWIEGMEKFQNELDQTTVEADLENMVQDFGNWLAREDEV